MADVFISYSHTNAQLATAIQRGLTRLGKPWNRPRALRVFRDKTDLAASPELWTTIQSALGDSRYFLLLASPPAAESHWVSKEIEFWLQYKDPRTFLIALTDGDIVWDNERNDFDWSRTTALPSVLAGQFRGGEPLWVDLRPHTYAKASLDDLNFADAVATLAAPIHGKSKADLVGEELRQQRRYTRARNAVAAGLAVLTVVAVVMGIGFFNQRNSARGQRDLAVTRQLIAQSSAQMARNPRVARLLAVAAARMAPGSERDQAIATLRTAILNPGRHVLRGDGTVATSAIGAGTVAIANADGSIQIWNARSGAPGITLTGHTEAVESLSMSADGSTLVSASKAGPALVWNVSTGERLHELRSGDGFYRVGIDPSGAVIATSSAVGLQAWSPVTGGELWRGPRDTYDWAFSANGSQLAHGTSGGVVLRDSQSGTRFNELTGASAPLGLGGTLVNGESGLGFGDSDTKLVGAHGLGLTGIGVGVWSAADGREAVPMIRLATDQRVIGSVAIGHERPILVTGDGYGVATIWDTAGGKPPIDLSGHTAPVGAASISPDDGVVATGSVDGTVRLWEATSGLPIAVLTGHGGAVDSVAFDEDDRVISRGEDDTVRVWDTVRPHRYSMAGESGSYRVLLSADGSKLATGGEALRLWTDDGQAIRTVYTTSLPVQGTDVEKPVGRIRVGAFSQDGSHVAITEDGVTRVFDTETGAVRTLVALPGSEYKMRVVTFSPDGGTLVTGAGGLDAGLLQFWDVANGNEIAQIAYDDGFPDTAVFSPDGTRVAVGVLDLETSPGSAVDIVDAQSRATVTTLSGVGESEYVLAFSGDGNRLVTSDDRTVHMWDLATGNKVDLLGHSQAVEVAAFGPGDSILATAGYDRTIRIWDVVTGSQIGLLDGGHSDVVRALSFRPDGALVSSGDDHAISIWDLSMLTGDLLATACEQAGSGFTNAERDEFLSGYGEVEAC